MDKDSTGKGGPEATARVGSGSPSTPGASGNAAAGQVHTGVSHTDTAAGLGSGKLTENPAPTGKEEADSDDTSPTNRDAGGTENAKNADYRSTSGDLNGQDADDVADRMKSTGRHTGNA